MTITDATKKFLGKYLPLRWHTVLEPADMRTRDFIYRLNIGLLSVDAETRRILMLSYVRGLPLEAVATQMSLSLSTIKRRASAGLRQCALSAFGFSHCRGQSIAENHY